MYNDVILLSALIIVLFIIWIALKLNVRVRRQKLEQIKSLNLANYVTFINNYTQGEEAEKKGDKTSARRYFQKALLNLEEEQDPDELTRDAIKDIKERIDALLE